MTEAEIATEIAKTTGIDKAAVVAVIEQFMSVVKDSLAQGENVYAIDVFQASKSN